MPWCSRERRSPPLPGGCRNGRAWWPTAAYTAWIRAPPWPWATDRTTSSCWTTRRSRSCLRTPAPRPWPVPTGWWHHPPWEVGPKSCPSCRWTSGSVGPASGQRAQQLLEAIEGLLHPFLHARVEVPVAVLVRRVQHVDSEPRLPALLHQGERVESRGVGEAFVDLGGHEAVGRSDLAIGPVPALFAAAVPHDVAPAAADPQVDVAHHEGSGLGAPPASDVLGRGPCLEHQPGRCVEDSSYDDLAIGGKGHRCRATTTCRHRASPHAGVRAGMCPSDRVARSSGARSCSPSRGWV